MSKSDYTKLSVTNNTDHEVDVYVTFAAANSANKCCPSPAKVADFSFLTKVNDLMGTFKLGAKQTQVFDPSGQCFSGNIGFYIEPQCPVSGADFHHGKFGTNIAEFTLNPNTPCAEAIDISCVNGVNCFMQMKVDSNDWSYGPKNTPIAKIFNRAMGENQGNPGVYPVNCTDCVRLVGNAPCPSLPVGPAQLERICNVQRYGKGGVVEVTLETPEIA